MFTRIVRIWKPALHPRNRQAKKSPACAGPICKLFKPTGVQKGGRKRPRAVGPPLPPEPSPKLAGIVQLLMIGGRLRIAVNFGGHIRLTIVVPPSRANRLEAAAFDANEAA
jgi:hypothetical protein